MKRRAFLQTAALSTMAAVSLSPLSLGQNRVPIMQRTQDRRQARRGSDSTSKVPIGVQLYSVRNAARDDIAATLAAIAKMGYEGVEFYGGYYFDKDPKDIRKMLDDLGLKCCGTHTPIGQFRGENFEKTAEIHKILGAKFMIVPGGIDKELHDVEKNKAMANEFSQLAEKAKPFGLFVGYHAHSGDAKLIDGIPAWERLFDAAAPEVFMQMDIGNYMAGGGDPYKMIEKFKGRSKTVHLKESNPGAPIIGDGEVDWKRAFDLLDAQGRTEWYVVEDEKTPDNLDRIEKCIAALRNMGK